jgi:hypothetical protein
MSDIGTERIEPSAGISGGIDKDLRREPRPRRPQGAPAKEESDPAEDLEPSPHEVDSLA